MASIEAAGGGMKDVDLEEGGNDADTHHLGDEAYSRSEAEDSKTLHSYTASSGNGSASETRNNMDMRGLHGSARRPSVSFYFLLLFQPLLCCVSVCASVSVCVYNIRSHVCLYSHINDRAS